VNCTNFIIGKRILRRCKMIFMKARRHMRLCQWITGLQGNAPYVASGKVCQCVNELHSVFRCV